MSELRNYARVVRFQPIAPRDYYGTPLDLWAPSPLTSAVTSVLVVDASPRTDHHPRPTCRGATTAGFVSKGAPPPPEGRPGSTRDDASEPLETDAQPDP